MHAHLRYVAIVLVIGVSALVAAMLMTQKSQWEPTTFGVNLQSGKTRSQVFAVRRDADYLIELEVDRELPFDELNCLLGVNPGTSEPCAETSPIELDWVDKSASRIVAKRKFSTAN